MLWLALLSTGILLIFALTMLSNVFLFPRLRPQNTGGVYSAPTENLPFISVLVPARNEAAVIAETVKHLLAQDYPYFEVLVLDDKSTDNTGAIAQAASQGDKRLRVLEGTPLPKNWLGKNWACQQLAESAQGEMLIFTDADVQWQAGALRALVAQMQASEADLLTVWASQKTVTWSERLVVPLMALVILGYLPVLMVHHSPFALFAAANGQCMAWRRKVYEAIGGHAAVANNVLEDVTMARLVKQGRYRLRMVDSAGLLQTRMYTDWQTVRDGFAKNILAGYGNHVTALILASLLHWLLFLFPFMMLLDTHYRLWGVLLILLEFSLRGLSAAFTRQRVLDAIGMSISVLLMTVIAGQALYWHYTGGAHWKGRKIGG